MIFVSVALCTELPKPNYDNSFVFSITYDLNGSSSEIAYIKSLFGNGIYAPLSLTNAIHVSMDWSLDPSEADSGIQGFKDKIDALIAKAQSYELGLHVTIIFGLSRNPDIYKPAKEEDIRNAQWYNDNNLAASGQLSGVINSNVFGTFSRYARKLRASHEAKIAAMYTFLKQKQDDNPDLVLTISGPGEAELNYNRIDDGNFLQTYFCDYSPFAILEFRDWIRHTGMYASGGAYESEGYAAGGTRYQGMNGLQNFNTDFGTSFTSWNLKYYDWSLNDSFEEGALPFSSYSFGGQTPISGTAFSAGGFDPPRIMQQAGADTFWDLWHSFRELLVGHYVKDMLGFARDSGADMGKIYTHQIPSDHLFGTRPDDPLIPFLNPRYYSSASPMWTAFTFPDSGMGITLYDLKINESLFFRTSLYAAPNIAAMSSNWAALEYNPEIHAGSGIPMSSTQAMYDEMIRIYNNNAHVMSHYFWMGASEWQYKDTNRELAAIQMFNAIKDCARQPVGSVFKPTEVSELTGAYIPAMDKVDLGWSQKIWPDLPHFWDHWGDFKEFVVFRGYTSDFICNSGSEIGRTASMVFTDHGFLRERVVYYKIAAVNSQDELGPESLFEPIITTAGPMALLNVSRSAFVFASNLQSATTSSQQFMVLNEGEADMNWTITENSSWLSCQPQSGINSKVATISVDPSGLGQGTYSASIAVASADAFFSPKIVNVTLNVKSVSATQPPIGFWDTPLDGTTQVRGQIPVTGWALDDIEVDRVEIWRRAEPEDPPEAINSEGLAPVGTALFVEGARPNLETDFPYNQYPWNYKGGWGYMLLTYGLPRRGNGTYILYAFVWDIEGKRTSLGTKTITCDNDNAVKPFGTIDTPAPGMVFPHSLYGNINFGWVLTPQPKIIPFNGSSIYVYIDGVLKGNLSEYGNYSESVATMFPGYQNTNNCYGHYFIDLASYENGVHNIQWTAYDSDGVGEGIGSRYFNIDNTGSSQGSMQAKGQGIMRRILETNAQPDRWKTDLAEVPNNSTSLLGIRRGFEIGAKLEETYPNQNGIITVGIQEVNRIEVHLYDIRNSKKGERDSFRPDRDDITGYLVVGEELRPLPIGSTLDTKQGIFYWQPGAGFFGKYELVFVRNLNGRTDKTTVIVKIFPKFQ